MNQNFKAKTVHSPIPSILNREIWIVKFLWIIFTQKCHYPIIKLYWRCIHWQIKKAEQHGSALMLFMPSNRLVTPIRLIAVWVPSAGHARRWDFPLSSDSCQPPSGFPEASSWQRQSWIHVPLQGCKWPWFAQGPSRSIGAHGCPWFSVEGAETLSPNIWANFLIRLTVAPLPWWNNRVYVNFLP